jgi:hypothetical protein
VRPGNADHSAVRPRRSRRAPLRSWRTVWSRALSASARCELSVGCPSGPDREG